jgi:Rrf2 family nitric oxide-sensitive transcriptional repressor
VFSKTTILAIRVLTYIGLNGKTGEPFSPRRLAEELDASPTYVAKVTSQLARAGILRAQRGALGGVVLGRRPENVTLQAVVEACQGTILGDFCQDTCELVSACAFHQASAELHRAIVAVLSRWTLAQLLARPLPTGRVMDHLSCFLLPMPCPGPEAPSRKAIRGESQAAQ